MKNVTVKIIKNVVVGSGAAGFHAASRLHQFGETDFALVTEGISFGTSRNTGSDKQTYYKLSLAGADRDSILDLAQDLFAGQCVDGDIALCEAALSVRCFYHLVELGVPFPCNEYGEFVGYKTDHDRGKRATSVGPYTSRIMTECLEADVKNRHIQILDGLQVIRLLTNEKKIYGILCLDRKKTKEINEAAYTLIWCENCIFATGGPAGMYYDSAYPASQTGSSGIAFEAGVKGKNLTEWQYGMASLRPRWNVSGTYMQVLPRVVSTEEDGSDEREFLLDYFDDVYEMQSMLFLKGYQWPFDTNKIFGGSSVIDLLVYQERCIRGRRVFLDYRQNTGNKKIEFDKLSGEAYEYLSRAHACFGTPIERLREMNEPAIAFYQEHGIDLSREMLEIAICAQHNNGGLSVDANWETNISGLYAVGEVCGSHGVTRPGGTALNAGQVGSLRAAEHIAAKCSQTDSVDILSKRIRLEQEIASFIRLSLSCDGTETIAEVWKRSQKRMSRSAGMIRNLADLKSVLEEAEQELQQLSHTLLPLKPGELAAFYHLRDLLLSQVVYISAMIDYKNVGGESRGSALYTNAKGKKANSRLPDLFRCCLDNRKHADVVQELCYCKTESSADRVAITWRPVHPLPDLDYFFENEWKKFRERMPSRQ